MDTKALNTAISREKQKLERQLASIEATKATVAVLERELAKQTTAK